MKQILWQTQTLILNQISGSHLFLKILITTILAKVSQDVTLSQISLKYFKSNYPYVFHKPLLYNFYRSCWLEYFIKRFWCVFFLLLLLLLFFFFFFFVVVIVALINFFSIWSIMVIKTELLYIFSDAMEPCFFGLTPRWLPLTSIFRTCITF